MQERARDELQENLRIASLKIRLAESSSPCRTRAGGHKCFMKVKQLNKHLRRHGCYLVREGSKHSLWANPELMTRTVVSRHTEIDNGLAYKICKDLQIPRP